MGKDGPTLEELERARIARALAETDNKTEAAEALGIARTTLYRKIEKYSLGGPSNLGFGGPPAGEGGGLLDDVLDN